MDYEMMIILEFIGARWAEFEGFCAEKGEDADDIYEAVGGNE
jgi:hypothetical protein